MPAWARACWRSGDDEAEAARIAVLLDKLNRERKAIETEMLEEAMVRADACLEANPDAPILIVASEGFHKGVVGLVASRLVDRFHRPACVIAWDEQGLGTGSLRSIDGVDIGAAVRAAVAAGHLAKGGGHTMAAGLSVARDRIAELEAFLGERLAATTRAARSIRVLDIDGALTPASVTDELMALIERAGPFGQGNPEPRFAFPAAAGEVRQGGGHRARALRAGGRRRRAARCGGVPRRRPAGGRGAARAPTACRCTSPATCAATPGTAATGASW